jgi:glyoxylase-like metal-dependent hydrolase (beta-lactamase superfamily II)
LLLAAPSALRAQPAQDFSKVEIETQPVAPGLSMLVGAGGNLGVSTGDDGVMLIDDQYAPLHAKIAAAVAALHPGPLRFVLNTHWHGDHTGGNELFGRGGALIVAHDAARARLAAGGFMQAFGRQIPPAPAGALPVLTFGADLTFHWNGDELHVFHVASAHTDGDAVVHFRRANALHTGDVFITGRYPFIDLDSGGTLAGTIAACDRMLALADAKTRIIPGHGPLAGRDELLRYRDMLVLARERVGAALASGQSLDALLAKSPLADLDSVWGGGFVTPERFLRSLVASIEAERAAR